MKATISEIKKNLRGTNSVEEEAENQTNNLEHKEGKNIQSEQQKEKIIPKNEDRLRKLWDNFICSKIRIIGVSGGEEEEQESENLFEQIMKENFPNLAKELDIQIQEAQSPKQDGPNEGHTETHHN